MHWSSLIMPVALPLLPPPLPPMPLPVLWLLVIPAVAGLALEPHADAATTTNTSARMPQHSAPVAPLPSMAGTASAGSVAVAVPRGCAGTRHAFCGAHMMRNTALSIACVLTTAVIGCKEKDNANPAEAPAGKLAPASPKAPGGALASAIAKVNACPPDSDCPDIDALHEAARSIGPDEYRGAMQIAKSHEVRNELNLAIAPRLNEALLLELVQAADSCPADGECQAEEDLRDAVAELTPPLYRAGMKAAKTTPVKDDLVHAVSRKMKPELIDDLLPLIADPVLGRNAQLGLGEIEDTRALAQLAGLLDRHDHGDMLHTEVPSILAKYPNNPSSKAALPKLREMTKHDAQFWTKALAAVAVGKIEGEAAIPFLVDFIRADTYGPTRAAVVEQLAAFKTSSAARAELSTLVKDHDHDVSSAAAKGLN
jgi:hypothetical protein